MNKKLSKAIKEANKKIKDSYFYKRQIKVEVFPDNSTSVYLSREDTGEHWYIASTRTQSAAITAIDAYLHGLRHGVSSTIVA